MPAYLYLFDHCAPATEARDLCAFHASELPYVFGQIGSDAALPPNWPRPAGQDEQRLSRVMMDYWVAFARSGAPAAPNAPAWQAYSEQQAYMRFAKSATPDRNLLQGMLEMQEEGVRSEEHRYELPSTMRHSYAFVGC